MDAATAQPLLQHQLDELRTAAREQAADVREQPHPSVNWADHAAALAFVMRLAGMEVPAI